MTDHLIPLEQLIHRDATIVEDQLFTYKAITDPAYRKALEDILASKQKAAAVTRTAPVKGKKHP